MSILRGDVIRGRRRLLVVATVVVLGVVAAAYGGASASATTTSTLAVKTRSITGLGVVLVNAKGKTLYAFMKDNRTKVTCTGSCAGVWPPFKWTSSAKPTAGGAAKTALLGSDKNPSGGKVVTYNHWPLYTYTGDTAAGQHTGQGLNLNGGRWYVLSASGTPIKKTSSGGGGTTTTGGGWG